MAEMIYLNGAIVPRAEARISVYDHGFLYGYGLFETMRAYNGKIFRLEKHLDRLRKSTATIGLGLAGIDLAQACRDTLKANELQSARIRLTVSHGDAETFPWLEPAGQPTVVITTREYRPFSPEVYEQGYKIGISSYQRSRQSSLSGIKSTNYLVSVLARREVTEKGLDEALLLNEDGYITEGSTSNIFFVDSSGLVTPPLESGILPGITRDLIIELAKKLKINVNEANITPSELSRFQQAFLTASTMEIMPVSSISAEDGKSTVFQSDNIGEAIPRLMNAYKERVAGETGG